MSRKTLLEHALELSPDERLLLLDELWESIAADERSAALTDDQRNELRRRLDDYEKDPSAGSSWEDVERRITKRR